MLSCWCSSLTLMASSENKPPTPLSPITLHRDSSDQQRQQRQLQLQAGAMDSLAVSVLL